MITIFSATKPFAKKHTKNIQTNAIANWRYVFPKGEILLFGPGPGLQEVARKFNAKYISNPPANENGLPYLNTLFKEASKKAKHSTLCFSNADILFSTSMKSAIALCEKNFPKFLLVGRRYDVSVKTSLVPFSVNSEKMLVKMARKEGMLRSGGWIDFVIFKKKQYENLPAFTLGTPFWDKWFLWHTYKQSMPIIDCTDYCTIVHQTHDYAHHPKGAQGIWEGAAARKNVALAGGWHHGLSIEDASYKITKNGTLQKKSNLLLPTKLASRKILNIPLLQSALLKTRRLRNRI